ncbi:hypothetical protein jhhlp_008761 [Lomentospora prolificans]|uniref:ribonuclease T2 n=1 Tax=Lomentospora prolificans TaxID=41688 RepID=A0A2N3MYY2_9PEZI|nr:hypothetical protein jhhlp_008761 [Lomentospora prolificans]
MQLYSLFFAALASPALAKLTSQACPTDSPLSCQNTTAFEDTCCFNYPGGQILLTQFWDTDPSTGPEDSWTIHGLWYVFRIAFSTSTADWYIRPDKCDGSWEQYCDESRQYRNLTAMLNASAPCTLGYMQTYWKDYSGDDESFWEHEFDKHGTCMSPLEPSCYPNYQPGQEAVDYFKRTVKLFKTLPSYAWLAEAGIVPSETNTYTLAEIQAALRAHHGHDVIINCNNGELNELWYHFNVQGSIQSGKYFAVDPVGSPSTCPATGIKYLPKYSSTVPENPTSSTTAAPLPTGEAGALSGKGRFYVYTGGASDGFLISGGTWYRAGGTPATYTATPNSDGSTFTLATSKGKCAVLEDALSCASSVSTASSFGFDGTYLTFGESSTFYATEAPSGTAQGIVYTTPKDVSFQVTWVAS